MKSEIDKEIMKRVKQIREKLNISQRTLAEILNVSQAFIGQVESDKWDTKYSAHQLYLIAKYFGCPISDLFPSIDPLAP